MKKASSNPMNGICFYPLSRLSKMIREKEISSEALLHLFYEHIGQYNSQINAIVDLVPFDKLVLQAREKDALLHKGIYEGPLHGIPITVKDTFDVVGLKSTLGNPLMKNYVPGENAVLIDRLKKSGALIIGKTNLPMFSMDWKSENPWYGRTNNPYDLHRSPGGSSGGSAAALAAGFTPVELGSDAGGSIRVPAHFCGVCGLRPTEGLLDPKGHMAFPGKPKGLKYITVPGPLARNCKDLETMFNILADTEFGSDSKPVSGQLNIAYTLELGGIEIEEEYRELILYFLEKLMQSGHLLQKDQPVYDSNKAYKAWATIIGFDLNINMPAVPFKGLIAAGYIYAKFRDKLWAKGTYSSVSGNFTAYAHALNYKDEVARSFDGFLSTYDIWLTPVSPGAAFKHQPTGRAFLVNGKKIPYTQSMGSYTFTTALAGHPICVIPIGTLKNGMPVGIQIHARANADTRLLSIAQLLEQQTEGYKLPPLVDR